MVFWILNPALPLTFPHYSKSVTKSFADNEMHPSMERPDMLCYLPLAETGNSPPDTNTSVWQQLRRCEYHVPPSENNCFKLPLHLGTANIFGHSENSFSFCSDFALAVDAWQPLRGPAQTSQGVTCIYCQVCSTESTKVWKHQNVSLKITQHNLSTETIWRAESRGLRTPPWVPRLLQGLTPTWEGHCAASEGTAPQENVWSESHYSELLPRLAFNKLSGWLKNSTGSNCKAEFWFACSAFPAVILSGIGQLNLALLVARK